MTNTDTNDDNLRNEQSRQFNEQRRQEEAALREREGLKTFAQAVTLAPSKHRLDLPSVICTVRNHGPNRRVVIDRHLVGHELEAGQEVRDVEMLKRDVEHFKFRRENARRIIVRGRRATPHPIEIRDLRPLTEEEVQKISRRNEEHQRRLDEGLDPRPLRERIRPRGGASPQQRPDEDEDDIRSNDDEAYNANPDWEGGEQRLPGRGQQRQQQRGGQQPRRSLSARDQQRGQRGSQTDNREGEQGETEGGEGNEE